MELGNTGVSFKNADRYTSKSGVIDDLPHIWVLYDDITGKQPSSKRCMIGCVKAVVNDENKIVEIGPVAVRREYQVLS